MNKNIKLVSMFNFSFIVCFIVVFISLFPMNGYSDVITLRADMWFPYNGEPNSDKPGYVIEIADHIFKKAGHQIDYKLLNWARTCKEVESGKWDGAVGGSYEENPGCVFPEEELGIMQNTFYVKKGATTWRYEGVESLKIVKVGIIKDYSYGKGELNEYLKTEKSNLVQAVYGDNPLESNIKKLLSDRIDTLIEDKNVFEAMAQKMNVTNKIETAGSLPTDKSDFIFIAFSPKNPKSQEYAKLITEGIKAMRADGTLSKILDKYGLTDWK